MRVVVAVSAFVAGIVFTVWCRQSPTMHRINRWFWFRDQRERWFG